MYGSLLRGRGAGGGVAVLLVVVFFAGCGRRVVLPEGFAGAEARDADMKEGPDLWLVREGPVVKAACCDVTADGIWNVVLREHYGVLSLQIDEDEDGVPEYEGELRTATSEDFCRLGPGLMLDPQAERPRYTQTLEYVARTGGRRSLELFSRLGWSKVSMDEDGDGFREVVVSRENGRVLQVRYLRRGEDRPTVWVDFRDGRPVRLAWRSGRAVVSWDPVNDVYSVDRDGDGLSEVVVPADRAPAPNGEIYRLLMDSFAEAVGGLIGAR